MERIGERLVNWASVLEKETRAQAELAATMPFIHPHVALMPDAHLGKGATVGSVIPTRGAVMPAAVGVDIGCGMIAVRTQLGAAQLPPDRRALREAVEHTVPLSAGHYNDDVTLEHAKRRIEALDDAARQAGFDPGDYDARWRLQLGTLGSGNHFIEVSLDENDDVWLSCTRARGASATGSRSTTSRSPSDCAGSGGSTCPTPTWRRLTSMSARHACYQPPGRVQLGRVGERWAVASVVSTGCLARRRRAGIPVVSVERLQRSEAPAGRRAAGHAVHQHVLGHRRRDERREGPGRGHARPAADRQRQGRLSTQGAPVRERRRARPRRGRRR